MLQIRDRDEPVWGIDFKRTIGRKNEDIGWTNYIIDHDFYNLVYPGHMLGISSAVVSRSLKIKPYAAGGFSRTNRDGNAGQESDFDIDLEDVHYTLTSTLDLNATVNPDFAQANVDDVQVNLTRFPLFFEERREFFVKSIGLFEFGTGRRELKLLHTRRIGLTSGREPIPILYGARLTGKTQRMQFGVMNVRTCQHEGLAAETFGIYRMKATVLPSSYVGAMATHRSSSEGKENVAGGLDASFVFFDKVRLQSFLARSTTEGPGGEGWAVMPVWLTWYTDLLTAQAQYMIIQEQFDPDVGFVNRSNIRKTLLDVTYRPRPRGERIRQLTFNGGMTYFTDDKTGRLMTRDVRTGAGVILSQGDRFTVNYVRNLEQEDNSFLIAGRLPVPPGTYLSDEVSFRVQASSSRPLSGSMDVGTQDFWGGTRKILDVQPTFRWSNQFMTELSHTVERVSLPSGSFTSRLSEATLHLNLTNQWLTRTTVQHNALEREWGVHFRLNYIYRLGDNFFLVFSHSKTPDETTWGVIAKFTRTLEF